MSTNETVTEMTNEVNEAEVVLTKDAVAAILEECIVKKSEMAGKTEDEMGKEATVVFDVIDQGWGFYPERLKENTDKIVALLNELPEDFQEKNGIGSSIMNIGVTRTGETWAELNEASTLVVLGMAIGRVSVCAPQAAWPLLPHGAPYIVVTEEEKIDLDYVVPAGMDLASSQAISPDPFVRVMRDESIAARLGDLVNAGDVSPESVLKVAQEVISGLPEIVGRAPAAQEAQDEQGPEEDDGEITFGAAEAFATGGHPESDSGTESESNTDHEVVCD